MSETSSQYHHRKGPSNLLGLDYVAEAQQFKKLPHRIIDAHTHIHGKEASKVYRDAARLYGIELTYTMSQLDEAPIVRNVLGDSIQFMTIPSFYEEDRLFAHHQGYLTRIDQFAKLGAKVAKIWNAPRVFDGSADSFKESPFRINSSERRDIVKRALSHNMIMMIHAGDPDTWFATRYRDSTKYGTKRQQYDDLEEMLDTYEVAWIGAHMGGYPEDLEFLSGLLSRHPNYYLDCSATKWIVRELSKHEPAALREFFTKWQGRILFGSDIVSSDAHLSDGENKNEMAAKASNRDDAFALYASRYWALRTLFETNYDGLSPISDPDLHMVEPDKYSPDDAPRLRGMELSDEGLEWLYYKSAENLLIG